MDIYGNMDFFDSLEKIAKTDKKFQSKKYIEAAKDYVLQGFAEDNVAELLQLDGCDIEVSKQLAQTAAVGIPLKYFDNERPEVYADVKQDVEKTIFSGNVEAMSEYFRKYAGKPYENIMPRLIMAKDINTNSYINELHEELRPLVEGRIIENNLLASTGIKTSSLIGEKEKFEFDLFGVWPIYLIKKQARKMRVEESLIDTIDLVEI